MTTVMSGRPTLYHGIMMRSRLEAAFAAWLDRRVTSNWSYEPCAFGSADGQYLPDFRVEGLHCAWSATRRRTYIETKPRGTRVRPVMERMRIIWQSEPEALLVMAAPGNVAVADPGLAGADAIGAVWVALGSGGIGLAMRVNASALPWPDGYWKGPAPK